MGLPSMNAPPPSLMVQHPPVQPPPPGLSSATTFPSVRAPPPVRDAWDEFIERKEKDRLLVASHTSRRRHSSPSESYSSSESSSESSSSSRSRSRSRSSSWSRDRERERTRRKRRRSSHSSRERRRTRRTDLSHSPSRPYVLPASAVSSSRYHRNHRDNSLSHSFFTQQQHATHPHPHAPNSMAINTSGIPSGSPFPPPHSHRIPPLITFPPPPFLNLPPNTAASSFGAFQSTPTSLMSTNYRNTTTRNAATGASPFMFDERSQRRRSPRLPEPDRRGGTRTGGGVREREREKERDNERKERSRTDDSSSNRRRAHVNTTKKRAEGKVTRSRETNEREQRRNKPAHKQQQQHREGGVKRRERSETKGSTVAHDQLEKVKRDGKVVDEIKMRRMEDNSVIVEKEENDKKKKKDEKNEEKENDDFGGTGSDILIEKEDENNQTMIDLGEAKEVEEAEGSEAVILTATTEGSVSGADAENEEDAVNERDRNEKKKKKKKKKKHKKHEEGEEAERKKHHKQGTGNNEELVTTSEEHESPHKKSKKHKRSREEKEKHKEEKERRREERKRRKEERNHEESLKEEDVVNDTEMILKMVKKDTPLQQQLREIEENEISERVEMSKDDGSLLAAVVSSDSVMEKLSQQTPQRSFIEMTKCDKEKEEKGVDSSRREQKKGGSEVVSVESDKKVTSRGDDRMKTIKRTREDRSEEGTNEKRCRVSGATEKRTTERKTAEEGSDRRKDTVKREYHGASDHSRRRDEKHHSRVNVTLDRTSSWTERNSHRTDSTGTHHQSNKRRSEVKDGKELKFYKHVDEVGKSKETRNQVKPKIEHDTKSEPSIEEQRPEKRKSELESKRSQESTLTNSKRNDEKATVHRTNIRSNEDERIEKEKEKSKRSEERSERRTESSTRKKGSAKDTDSRKSSTHRRDREDVKVKEKKLDDIKVSIENELAEERKLDTSSSGGDLHRDKPNITVELKYGGEKKVTRENVFENLVPQFNARQKIKMILLSESERFAADKAKKKNVK